ncbi:MAG: hypothetical protein J6L69_04085 [Lachnospiraceae bacterium]|nr:hypothetical protein [Lachnospiraceae bacterium]
MKEIDKKLLEELDTLHRKGVRITLEGHEYSPVGITKEISVHEESNYMRDYILDDKGKLIELGFYYIE